MRWWNWDRGPGKWPAALYARMVPRTLMLQGVNNRGRQSWWGLQRAWGRDRRGWKRVWDWCGQSLKSSQKVSFKVYCPQKAMAPHSSTLAWKIPWTEEPGRLQSMGLLRVGHNWVTSLSLSCIGEGNGTPLQCSCLENPRYGGAWWAAFYGFTQSRTRLKWLHSSSSPEGREMMLFPGTWLLWTFRDSDLYSQ